MSLKRKAADAALADAKKVKANGSITSFFGPPKVAAAKTILTTTKVAAKSADGETTETVVGTIVQEEVKSSRPKFDKKKWAEKLTAEQKELLALEIATLDESWFAVLKDELLTKEFLALKRFLVQEHMAKKQIFPPAEDVYSWSRHTPFHAVKAVIIGQDPYHNHNQAHGMCFSVRPPTPAPPSLKNMYKALKIDYPDFQPPPNNGGLLTPWADRGVLLLNTCLTVRAHDANSHSGKGWERLTQRAIDAVAARRGRGAVFIAWGAAAGKRVAKVDRKKHCVLVGVHPSPLSAHRGFFECGHFRKTNEWLRGNHGEEAVIDWSLDVGPKVAGV
ncbi:uracil DNA glycosylase [Pseudogymnoascus destructans]|uniref:Uracil-DNA glycosylase n=2 Tax=Pseudogymnoascus destructans TaxID=655981 RepID=L8FMX2_PSED2|nr:uracil DNA glycosylase [Pseudogymnoascus destructans]ELR02305.1 hypothetical protein GMDG_05374 [Pseudogymnoascus destructans 20631-21]OAF58266.1 uracil DNA glycosylase [Pseudogymnoascus destructans]